MDWTVISQKERRLTDKRTQKRLVRMATREDNIRMELKEIGVSVNSWMGSDQDKLYRRALLMHIEPPDSSSRGDNYLSFTRVLL